MEQERRESQLRRRVFLAAAGARAAGNKVAKPVLERPIARRIESLEGDYPAIANSSWGAQFLHLASQKSVFARNERHTFVPASNTKLYTAALALHRLGAAHRFTTRLLASRPLDARGGLNGDLVLLGGGDPALSLDGLREMATAARASGLRRVAGSVVGDDSLYPWEPYGTGWAQDDTRHHYGAPVSALVLEQNRMVAILSGSEAGGEAAVSLRPALPYFSVHSRVRARTGSQQRPELRRATGSRQLEIWGTVPPRESALLDVAVEDPAHWSAWCLRETLLEQGIAVDGGVEVRHRAPSQDSWTEPPRGFELARRESFPLAGLLRAMLKSSSNLYAEMLLREIARSRGGAVTIDAALEQMSAFLLSAKIPGSDYAFIDGSGLSRLTLVSPAATVKLLDHMHRSQWRDAWTDMLPVGGEDGTLEERFTSLAAGRVMGKTGTLAHVSSLAGYVDDSRGERYAFSVMINNANAPAPDLRDFIDKIVGFVIE
ncbi:MAG: D-alanyl-D-alanine carboxypeptidase/D-alanyl-D-alanine-endopeptidase [Bryobacteraceae bacterium]